MDACSCAFYLRACRSLAAAENCVIIVSCAAEQLSANALAHIGNLAIVPSKLVSDDVKFFGSAKSVQLVMQADKAHTVAEMSSSTFVALTSQDTPHQHGQDISSLSAAASAPVHDEEMPLQQPLLTKSGIAQAAVPIDGDSCSMIKDEQLLMSSPYCAHCSRPGSRKDMWFWCREDGSLTGWLLRLLVQARSVLWRTAVTRLRDPSTIFLVYLNAGLIAGAMLAFTFYDMQLDIYGFQNRCAMITTFPFGVIALNNIMFTFVMSDRNAFAVDRTRRNFWPALFPLLSWAVEVALLKSIPPVIAVAVAYYPMNVQRTWPKFFTFLEAFDVGNADLCG